MGTVKDMVGQKFSKLEVIRIGELKPLKGTTNKLQFWICKCSCGKECEVSGAKLRSGHTQSCGCLIKETAAKLLTGRAYTRKQTPRESSAKAIWSGPYKKELPFDDFMKLSQENCYYCNAEPGNLFNVAKGKKKSALSTIAQADFIYNGLDRVDSSKTHTLDNVVTCCKHCNYAKRERSQEEFLKWALQLSLNIQKKLM